MIAMGDLTTLDQFRKESEYWKQRLEALQAESIGLKTIISERVSPDIDEDTLTKAESLHDQLMKKDEMIALLKSDIITFRNVIHSEISKDGHIDKLMLMRKKLLKEIETLEQKFSQLKSDFNQYLPGKYSV